MKLKFKDGTIIEVTDTEGLSKEEIIAEAKKVYKDFKDSKKSVKDSFTNFEKIKKELWKKHIDFTENDNEAGAVIYSNEANAEVIEKAILKFVEFPYRFNKVIDEGEVQFFIPAKYAFKVEDSKKVKDEPIYLGTEKLKKLDKKGLFALVKSKGGEEFNDEYYLTYKNKPQKKIEAENDKAAVKNFRELVKSGKLVAADSIKDALSKEFVEQINKEIGGRPFEIENENTGDFEVYYVELEEDGFLYAGSVANVGFLPNQELCVKYDEDYTLDENLQSLYEVIINKMYETPTIEDTQIRDDSALVSKVNNYLAETAGMPNVTYKDENLYTYILKLIDKKLNIAFNYEAAEGKNIELVLSYNYEVKKNPAALKTDKKEDFIKISSVTFSNGEVNGTEITPEDEAAAKEALNKIKSDPQIIKMIINYYRKEINAEMYSWAMDFGGFDTEDLEGEFDENGEWNPKV